MQHIFKQSKIGYLGLIFFVYLFYLLLKILVQSIEFHAISYIVPAAVLCFLWGKFIFKYWIIFSEKILVNENGIRLVQPLKSITYRWDEIIEFGRYWRIFVSHRNGAGMWSYYIKVRKSGEKKINISYENASMMEKLTPIIFRYAHNAQFVTLKNVSRIPLIKKYEKITWHKNAN